MAEEVNAAKVAPPSKTVRAASNRGTGGSHEEQFKEEIGTLVRSPNDANPIIRAENPAIYQADVVEGGAAEGEATTTEKPAEGGAAADAAAKPAAPAEGATDASPPAGAAAAPAEGEAAPAEATPASPATAGAPAAEAAAPTSPEGAEAGSEPAEGAEAKSPEGGAAAAATVAPTAAPGVAEATVVPGATAGMTTSVGPATGSPTPKDPYAIDIPLDKKINKRTQRKLWEEIEKRKPLVPKHVAQHIQKYAKPPFETWGCKFRGKGSCSGCK